MINYKEAKKILIKSKIKIKDEIINSSKSLNRVNVLDIYINELYVNFRSKQYINLKSKA